MFITLAKITPRAGYESPEPAAPMQAIPTKNNGSLNFIILRKSDCFLRGANNSSILFASFSSFALASSSLARCAGSSPLLAAAFPGDEGSSSNFLTAASSVSVAAGPTFCSAVAYFATKTAYVPPGYLSRSS